MANKKTLHIKRPNVAIGGPSKPIIRANANRETTVDPNFFKAYANDAQILMTPWDVRLVFGVITSIPTEPTATSVTVNQLGEIHVSPQLAKRLVLVMMQQLQAYEQQFGQIPLPQE